MDKLPTIPDRIVYAIERYKPAAVALYFMTVVVVCLPFIYAYRQYGTPRTVQSVITPVSPEQVTSHTVVNVDAAKIQAAMIAQQQATPKWPMKGTITTEFGVSHRPWQNTHTGMDIASGNRSGVTPVTPYKSGTVTKAVRSYSDYGNHVIVDHGAGLTSLYGHLSSISVITGQQVTTADVLGYEGNTGMSTGTHLHFEILNDGLPSNPRRFIAGTP